MFADRPCLAALVARYDLTSHFDFRADFAAALAQLGDAEAAALFAAGPGEIDLLSDDGCAEFIGRLTGASAIAPQPVTAADFARHRSRRFGSTNPEKHLPGFWSEQIRTGRSGYTAAQALTGAADCGHPPVWSFQRYGASFTRLPDGRWVVIAGEHEDHYDPDFCIYNDVTLFDGQGGVQHFLYPREDFPPTDFHTATLLDDAILLIGALGYPEDRREGETQVLRLDLDDFSIRPVETRGENPGWIHGHTTERTDAGLRVTGGKIEPGYRDRTEAHLLDPTDWTWHRLG